MPVTEPFATNRIASSDVVSTLHIQFHEEPLEIIETAMGTYRPSLDCHWRPLRGLGHFAAADPRQLFIGTAEREEDHFDHEDYAKFWLDHPGVLDPDLMAPDDPFVRARINIGRSPPYWRVELDDVVAASVRVQDILSRCVVMDDTLYRPTAEPGRLIRLMEERPVVVDDWLPGVSHEIVEGVFFDASESHLVERAIEFLERGASNGIARYPFERTGAVHGGRPAADARMVRLALRELVRSAGRSISSLGPDLALLYWKGHQALRAQDQALSRRWLIEARPLLGGAIYPRLRYHAKLITARLHALGEETGRH